MSARLLRKIVVKWVDFLPLLLLFECKLLQVYGSKELIKNIALNTWRRAHVLNDKLLFQHKDNQEESKSREHYHNEASNTSAQLPLSA